MPFPARQVKRLHALLVEIDHLTQGSEAQFGLRCETVSTWSVAEQLDHAVRVFAAILGRIDQPLDTELRPLNLTGRIILWMGRIPRGKGRSPKSVLPLPSSREDLRQSVNEARSLLDRIVSGRASESRKRIVLHPAFGGLTARQALRLTLIHTRHHLAITREILASRS